MTVTYIYFKHQIKCRIEIDVKYRMKLVLTSNHIIIACDGQYRYKRKFVKYSYASRKVATLTLCVIKEVS